MSHAISSKKRPIHIVILHEDPLHRHFLKTGFLNLFPAYNPGSRLTVSNEVSKLDLLLEADLPDAIIYGDTIRHNEGQLTGEDVYTLLRRHSRTSNIPLMFYTHTEVLRLAVRHWRQQGDTRVFHEIPHNHGPQAVYTTLRKCWRTATTRQPMPEPA